MIHNRIAIVFGGTGFLGKAVVQTLARAGYLVRVPTRDLEKAAPLKSLGYVGQIMPIELSVRNEADVATALNGASVVVNLIGTLCEKGKDSFQAVHVETAARLARLARAASIPSFVHISALGADLKAHAAYSRTKAMGEDAVRAFFPNAIILRPSILFGPGDSFMERLTTTARFLPFFPLFGGGLTRLQPVYVGDVAAALMACLQKPETQGRAFALGGPQIYTFKELATIAMAKENLRRPFFNMPWGAVQVLAFFLSFHPKPPLTKDQVALLRSDNIVTHTLATGRGRARTMALGSFENLGLTPRALESV